MLITLNVSIIDELQQYEVGVILTDLLSSNTYIRQGC